MNYYQDSNFVRQTRQAETDRFDRQMREQGIRKLFEAGANLDDYQMYEEDWAFVEQLKQEKALQDKHDEAFLEGFLNGGRHA